MWSRASVGVVTLAAVVGAGAAAPPAAAPTPQLAAAAATSNADVGGQALSSTCSPTPANRPVCSADAPLTTATFLDPTARVRRPSRVQLGERVYVAPFARLLAGRRAPIAVGNESNLQDNVAVTAEPARTAAELARLAALGLAPVDGVRTGERVILAHGSSVRGPARLGVLAEGQPAPDRDSGVFLSFGARVDGAVLERDTALSALSRVGPGVRLRSGFVVLPGKNVTTQAQADAPALGKVRPITQADRLFNEGVIHVNVGLAREYSRLAREEPSAISGINLDPGGNDFDRTRDAPTVDSATCTGPSVRRPEFRNRLIGDACFADSVNGLAAAMGRRISIRADEGGPLGVGQITRMGNGVIFHALEGTTLRVGDRVRYGRRVVVHGGGRPTLDPHTGEAAPTIVGNDVRLGNGAIVFRALVRNGTRVGARSAVVGSETAVGQRIPPRTVYANNEVFGPVEW
jgi:carbonic anhydrase/acetyltransferase-like protein (isoleucine patch superfamily)